MNEVTYLSEVECEVLVPNAMLDTQVIAVTDNEGTRHVLRVAKGGLDEHAEKRYLPVGLVNVDRTSRCALVELPHEADSGRRRIWVPFASFLRKDAKQEIAR